MEIEIGKTYFVKEWKFNIRIVGELKQFVFYAYYDNHHNVIVEARLRSEIENLIAEADFDEFEFEDDDLKNETDDFICIGLNYNNE